MTRIELMPKKFVGKHEVCIVDESLISFSVRLTWKKESKSLFYFSINTFICKMKWIKNEMNKNIRQKDLRRRQDSNLRGQSPFDFESNALTTRPRLLLTFLSSKLNLNTSYAQYIFQNRLGFDTRASCNGIFEKILPMAAKF